MTHERSVPRQPASPRRDPLIDERERLGPRAASLQRELGRLLFDLVERKRAGGVVPSLPERFPLKLDLEVFSDPAVEAHPEQILEQLHRAVDQWVERTAEFPYGKVYCYWCQSYTCEHSTPPETRDVFGGYSATGEPEWLELGAVLLARRDPRIERLYQAHGAPVSLVQEASELTANQLSIYGKHAPIYRLLGQLALGYVKVPGKQHGRVAITFQAVELSGGRAVLNVLGCLPNGRPTFDGLEEAADARVDNALRATRRALSELSLRRLPRRRRGAIKRQQAAGILRRLSRHLERVFRQGQRRTRHSQERNLDRRRPTASALGDALQAKGDAIYRDVEERTWVVIGPKNRVHIFNDHGKHVTSVNYSGDTVRGRTTRGKWRIPGRDDLTAFRKALRQRSETPDDSA